MQYITYVNVLLMLVLMYMKMFDMNLVLPEQYTNNVDLNLAFLDEDKNV